MVDIRGKSSLIMYYTFHRHGKTSTNHHGQDRLAVTVNRIQIIEISQETCCTVTVFKGWLGMETLTSGYSTGVSTDTDDTTGASLLNSYGHTFSSISPITTVTG